MALLDQAALCFCKDRFQTCGAKYRVLYSVWAAHCSNFALVLLFVGVSYAQPYGVLVQGEEILVI